MVGLRDGFPRIQEMLESFVEPALSCGNDVGGDVPDELDKEEVVDKPGTTRATGFTCNRRRKCVF